MFSAGRGHRRPAADAQGGGAGSHDLDTEGPGRLFYETWTDGKVRKIAARSVDVPRVRAKVEFERKFMSALRFRVEHLCEFLGAGLPLISFDVLDKAILSEPALCLT